MAKPIRIEILSDERGALRGFRNVDKGIGGLSKKFAALGGVIAGAFAVREIAQFGGELFNLAANLTDQGQKISAVFGDQEEDVRQWADTLNEAFGVTGTEVSLMAANVADLLKPMGATTEEAAAMSKEVVELAPALAEWSGGTKTAAEVSDILSKAMLGEREQLKGLGIAISQAEVNTRALEVAQAEGRSEITQMDKAIATQQLIFEKSTDAQAGYVTGTHTLAGVANLAKARWAEFKEFLAKQLTPAFLFAGQQLTMFLEAFRTGQTQDEGTRIERFALLLRDRLIPAVQRGIAFFQKWGPVVARLAVAGFGKLADFGGKAWTVIKRFVEFVNKNREVLIGVGVAVAAVVVPAFAAWAISAAAAAASVVIAAAPVIALGVAVGALAFLIRKAYRENDTFRAIVDKVAGAIRDNFMPGLRMIGRFLRDKVGPVVVAVGRDVAKWVGIYIEVQKVVVRFAIEVGKALAKILPPVINIGRKVHSLMVKPFKDGINQIRDAWNRLKNLLSKGVSVPNPFKGFSLPGFAMGTSSAPGGLARVGERGPETVLLPKGAAVRPAHMSGSSGGDTFNIYGPSLTAAQVMQEAAWARRSGNGR